MFEKIVFFLLNLISNFFRISPYWLRNLIATILAILFLLLGRSRNKTLQENLQFCIPQINNNVNKPHFNNSLKNRYLITYYHAIALIDSLACFSMSNIEVEKFIEVIGIHHLVDKSKDTKKGKLLYFPHFIGLLPGTCFTTLFLKIALIYSPSKQKFMARWMELAFKRRIPNQVFKKNNSIMPLARLMKKKALVQLSTDLDVGTRDTIIAPFFGLPSATSPAVPYFAKRFGAKLIGGVCYYTPNNTGKYRYRLVFEPINIDFSKDDDKHINSQTLIHQWLEEKIREHPLQYWWFHKRFKSVKNMGLL